MLKSPSFGKQHLVFYTLYLRYLRTFLYYCATIGCLRIQNSICPNILLLLGVLQNHVTLEELRYMKFLVFLYV